MIGSYVHGLFDDAHACAALLRWAGLAKARLHDYVALREREIDRLADAVEASLDLARLLAGITHRPAAQV